MPIVTDRQVRRLHALLKSGRPLSVAAMRVDMDRKTAPNYRDQAKLPVSWRPGREHGARGKTPSRPSGKRCESNWNSARPASENPVRVAATSLPRSLRGWSIAQALQRRVRQWEATCGPPKEVFFAQTHHPGRLGASDFTHMTSLGVTIGGQSFDHMVYHFVLTYSNWETASICFSESFESLSDGLQQALWVLGGAPQRHRTDRMSLAVNNASESERIFTRRYQALMDHYGFSRWRRSTHAKLMKTATQSRATTASRRLWTRHCFCVAAASL